ncbi:helix-turn-helix domain-containing protein [Planococcus sp. FY231025]|uniref:helix-turn-helix domain-containing protein n=1 Tax=Planococcus sp. FY231025 TaxID=3455699 RepID=UPI003F9392EE
MNIGSVIKYYRTKNNMTQLQLADGICSISHLSKIESNTYTPHESTIEALLAKMGVHWSKEIDKHNRLQRQLSDFIDCLLHYDLENTRRLFKQLEQENDYLQSTDLVNQFELYKFRFYVLEANQIQAEAQKKLLERLQGSFTAPEKWLYQFFQAIYYSMLNKNDKALGYLDLLDQGIQSIPQKFEGEYYYQKARLLILLDRFEVSAYYAELAVQFYQLHYNYIRLLHAQLLLAMNYTRRNLLVQASGIYTVLTRNAQLTGQTELYHQTVYNYVELLMEKGEALQAYEMLQEIRQSIPKDTDFYKAVLLSKIEAAIEAGIDPTHLIEEVRTLIRRPEDEHFEIYVNYFEKRNFSQPDLMTYSEEKMFPFFRKNGYIKESKKIAADLVEYYQQQKEWEKANFYRSYHNRNGGELL